MKVKPVKLGRTERMSFSDIDEVISMPNLIAVQKNSYQWFLDEGLKEVFHDIGTIEAVSYTHLEKSRAKERIFSFRNENHAWDPKNQRPEMRCV